MLKGFFFPESGKNRGNVKYVRCLAFSTTNPISQKTFCFNIFNILNIFPVLATFREKNYSSFPLFRDSRFTKHGNVKSFFFPRVTKSGEMWNMLNLRGLVLSLILRHVFGIRPPIRSPRLQNIQKYRIFQTFGLSPPKTGPPNEFVKMEWIYYTFFLAIFTIKLGK